MGKKRFTRFTTTYFLFILCISIAFVLGWYFNFLDIYEVQKETQEEKVQVTKEEIDNVFMEVVTSLYDTSELLTMIRQQYERDIHHLNVDFFKHLAIDDAIVESMTEKEKTSLYLKYQIEEVLTTILNSSTTRYTFMNQQTENNIEEIFYIPEHDNLTTFPHVLQETLAEYVDFLRQYSHTFDLYPTSGDKWEKYLFYEDNQPYLILRVPLEVDKEIYGSLHYILNMSADKIIYKEDERAVHLTPLDAETTFEEKQIVEQAFENNSFEEAIQILEKDGYRLFIEQSELNELSKQTIVVSYVKDMKLTARVLRTSLKEAEVATIVISLLFVSFSMLLFKAIISPTTLLIQYVSRCNKGQYDIPPKVLSEWRPTFLIIRDAYLENERLLKIKEKQSKELEHAWRKADAASQAKTQFLAKVSHELRTPLNAIKGYIQLLKLSVDQPKQVRQLDIIDSSSDLLLSVVKELLDFSRIEEGKIRVDCSEIDMPILSRLISYLFINEMTKKEINYEVHLADDVPRLLYGDENKIKQVLINLVSNASKFTEKGSISVLISRVSQDDQVAMIKFEVKDTGKGIASDKLCVIFDAFTQENNSISRRYGGTGLGLSISKGITEALGGHIEAKSTENVGSTFTVIIPLKLKSTEEKGD